MDSFDFGDGKGSVPAKQHINPDGSVGGWVATTAHTDRNVYIGTNARVYGRAAIQDFAEVRDNAHVSGDAFVYDRAKVVGHARVLGNASVSKTAVVCGEATIFGYARIYGSARVSDHAKVGGDSYVGDDATISGDARINGEVFITNSAHIYTGFYWDDLTITRTPPQHIPGQMYIAEDYLYLPNGHFQSLLFAMSCESELPPHARRFFWENRNKIKTVPKRYQGR